MDQSTADYLVQRSTAHEQALGGLFNLLIDKKLISRREATDALAARLQLARSSRSPDGVVDGLESILGLVSR